MNENSKTAKIRSPKHTSFKDVLEWIIRRPTAIILTIAAITLLLGWHLPRLSFRTSIYDLVIEDLPEKGRYEDFKKIFGSDEIIRIVIKGKNVFDPITFQNIEHLAAAASRIEGVRRVISLPGIKKAVDVTGKWNLEEFASIVAPVKLFQRNLISEDRKVTVLTLVLGGQASKAFVIQAVKEMIAGASKDLSLYQIGMPLVSQALARYTEDDFFRLPPVTLLLIAVILFLLFRNVLGFLLPITCIMTALVWTFGLMAWSRTPLSMLTMIVPVFLIAVGTAYCLHIFSEYLACAAHSDSPKNAAFSTFSSITFPTILAVSTTVMGIGSVLVNRIPTIREFALFSCFGMFSLLVIVLTLFPAALAIMPLPRKRTWDTSRITHYFNQIIAWIIDLNLNRQKITLPILGALVLISLAGIFHIRVETNPIGYLKKDAPVNIHFHDIYKDLSGSFPIHVVMESKDEDFFADPAHIGEIARLQAFIATLPGVDKTVSFADYLKLVSYALNKFDPKYYKLPEEAFEVRMLINNYKSMLGEDMLTRFMSKDFSKANILLLTHISSSREFLETRNRILRHVQQKVTPTLTCDVTGFGIVVSASSHLLIRGQIKSLSLTMILVFGIMFVLFLSYKVGIIAIVPNLFPIIINFGIMGWFGIEISMVTSLIASIAIGLGVDDTIHYLVRYNREFKKDLDDKRALRETLMQVGKPIIFSTLTISVGFSVLAFSSFKPTAMFGIMMVITMLSALVGDMILLPSLMLHVELVTLWDLVRLKLGKDPQQGIPLFNGLSRTQVHYIIMAGSLKQINAGEVLFRKGDPSDSIYAVISGSLNVTDSITDGDTAAAHNLRKLIANLKTGDIVGEMGLLRSTPRSATIIASESGELLKINLKMIKRLQWLYPPTAQKFLFNLMTILCDRLERTSRLLIERSHVDDLTGLPDRKNFLEILGTEMYRSQRYGSDLSLCLLEIDFKAPDIHANHDNKDRILRLLSKTISVNIRKSDILGRIDIRTFALLMPRTSRRKAQAICKRLQNFIEKEVHEDGEGFMAISIELTSMRDEENKTAMDLLARATKAMVDTRKS